MPLGDIFIAQFGLSAVEYTYLVSAYAFGAVGSSMIAFLMLDRFDRKKALLVLYSGFVVGTLLCGFADSYFLLVLLRFFTGSFGGVIGALAFAIVADLYAFKERGAAIGILMGAFSAASALGVPFGLYLAASYSWRVPFIGLGAIGAITALLILFFFPSIRIHMRDWHHKPSMASTVKSLFYDRNQVNALVLGMVLVLGHFVIIPFISPFMIRNVGFTQMDVTYIFLFGGIAMVFSSPLVGRLTDVYGVVRIFTIFIFLSFIPTIAITHMDQSSLWFGLLFTTLFFIFASGRMIPANTLITAAVGSETRGSFMSMKSALQQLAVGLASVLSGMIVYINEEGYYERYHFVAYVSIFFCLVSIFLCTRLRVAEGN